MALPIDVGNGSKKMTLAEFGDVVKSKYPQYSGVDSAELGRKMVAKYPQYSQNISDEAGKPNAAPVQQPSVVKPGQGLLEDTRNFVKQSAKEFTAPMRQFVGGALSSVGTFGANTIGATLKGGEYIGEKLGEAQTKLFGLPKTHAPAPLQGLGQRVVTKAQESIPKIQGLMGADVAGKPLTQLGKLAGDVAQTITPGGGVKQLAGLTATKEGAKQLGKLALKGAVEGAVYSAGTEGKVSPSTVGSAALIEAGIPVIGAGVKALGKIAPKQIKALASKLQSSGIMNPAKFDQIRLKLIDEGVDSAKSMKSDDVATWMLKRNIKGSKEAMSEKALQISNDSQEAKKGILQLSSTLHNPDVAKTVINDLLGELKGSASTEYKNMYKSLSDLKAKADKGGLSLSDLDYVRGKAWEILNPFTASGKVKRASQDVKNVVSELKRYIEDAAETEGLGAKAGYKGKNIIRDLNNQTSIGREISEGILRKDSSDATAQIISFLSSRGAGLLGGGILGSQAGPFDSSTVEGKIGNIIVGSIVGSAAGSSKVKSNVANLLDRWSGKQKSELYEWMKSRGSKKATEGVKKMIDSVSTILSKQTPDDLRPMRSPVVFPANSNVDRSILISRTSMNAPSGVAKVVKQKK